jgi:hypothetical protein
MLDIAEIAAACACVTTESEQHLGTAYLVSSQFVATCAHVVKNHQKGVKVHFAEAERTATVEHINHNSDCALLILSEPLSDVQPLHMGGAVKWKALWDGYGFPEIADGAGISLEGWVMNPKALDDKKRPVLELFSPQFAAGVASPLAGFSGSPVIVDDRVVGHLKRIISDPNDAKRAAFGKVYATRADCIAEFLLSAGGDPASPAVRPPIVPPLPDSPEAERLAQKVENWVEKWEGKEGVPEEITKQLAAESLVDLGRPTRAIQLLASLPHDLQTSPLYARALWETGKPTLVNQSIDIAKKLRRAGTLDAETSEILGDFFSRKWQQTEDKRYLQQAFEVYCDAFEATKDPWQGVNAAHSAVLLDNPQKSRMIAEQVLQTLEHSQFVQLDQMQLAVMGRAHLLIGDLGGAAICYEMAIEQHPDAKQAIKSMQSEARTELKAIGLSTNALSKVFRKS